MARQLRRLRVAMALVRNDPSPYLMWTVDVLGLAAIGLLVWRHLL